MSHLPSVDQLLFYPVKSCGAVSLNTAFVGSRGLVSGQIGDRRWMIVDEDGVLVSQRGGNGSLAAVKITLLANCEGVNNRICASAEGRGSIILDPEFVTDKQREVQIHGKKVISHLSAPEISQWFSDYLNKKVSLVFQKDSDKRWCDQNFAADDERDLVSFADGFSYLVTTRATLDRVNALESIAFSMDRFRPNIVIGNTGIDDEYSWRFIQMGSASLALLKPCDRCEVPTIDQSTGIKTHDQLPLMLAKEYGLRADFGSTRVQGLIFGENAQASRFGEVSVGDAVHVIESKPIYAFRRKAAPAPGA